MASRAEHRNTLAEEGVKASSQGDDLVLLTVRSSWLSSHTLCSAADEMEVLKTVSFR